MRVVFANATRGAGSCPRCKVNVFKGMAICHIGYTTYCRPCGTAISKRMRAADAAHSQAMSDAAAKAKRDPPED